MNSSPGASRFVIGIDLGTTNCALSYIDTLSAPREVKVLPLKQWVTRETTIDRPTLPSFFYFLTKAELKRGELTLDLGQQQEPLDYVVGQFAKDQATITPGRVVHAAKSWLSHAGIDREEKILPWHSDEIIGSARRSPVEVSASYLLHLRQVWDQNFATLAADYAFDRQDITITVPASFDEGASNLTLEAARLAGYPMARVRLLEEPQAAFYYWLNTKTPAHALLEPREGAKAAVVLICDIGGGTTDFSLFEVSHDQTGPYGAAIKRVAVSDHILLGGDNIDLAIAHRLEADLVGDGPRLDSASWATLVAESRRLKERVLSEESPGDDEPLHVAIAQAGASLFSSALSVTIRPSEVRQLILDGFFPDCPPDARPQAKPIGLKEWGLPYAQDSAITRQLAGFLAGRRVDAVLYTGGTMKPTFVRERLTEILDEWQKASAAELSADTFDLAVSGGAAFFGQALREPQRKIGGGYARSLYVEVVDTTTDPVKHSLVCVLPKGYDSHEPIRLGERRFKLAVGQPARFQLFSALKRGDDRPGDVLALDGSFHPLPSLQTKLERKTGRKSTAEIVDVALEARLTETGIFELYLVEIRPEGEGERWQLSFNVRAPVVESAIVRAGASSGESGAKGEQVARAVARIQDFYGRKKADGVTGNPKHLVRELEQILGKSREDWPIPVLRSLWAPLADGLTRRGRSVDHESSWLYLAGYSLRPGYGQELDEWRVADLWRAFQPGMSFPASRQVEEQWWIMWRRVAGGLGPSEQNQLFDKVFPSVRKGQPPSPEVYMLVGSLERADMGRRIQLGGQLARMIAAGPKEHLPQKIWALARLASRVPLYGGPETIIRPAVIADWYDKLRDLPLRDAPFNRLSLFYAQSGRIIGDREFDLPDDLRARCLEKLRASGASADQIQAVESYVPVDAASRNALFGETLPAGLVLA